MKPMFLILTATLLLGGCSSTLSPQVDEYTIAAPPAQAETPKRPMSSDTLRISATKTIPSLSSRNLYYLRGVHEIGSYLHSRWSDTPPSMIDRYLASSLEGHRVFSAILPPFSSAQAVLILESDLRAFDHRFRDDRRSEGYLDITYRLIDARTKLSMGSRRFQISVDAETNDAKGGAGALAEATRELGRQCTQWLIERIQEKQ